MTNKEYAKLKNWTNRYHLLKFEDLSNNPKEFIQTILKIAGFRGNHRKTVDDLIKTAFKNPSVKNYDQWQNWESRYALYLHRQCGKLMQQYGYGREEEWLNRIY
ncbi:MAG: hypothetical protein U5L07_02785 [Desulfobacterales bacterium]|nr:hypothetical protein [Desulfobacterales bacterium]